MRAGRSVSAMATTALGDTGEFRHAGRPAKGTGPRVLSFNEAVERLAETTGRRIRYICVSTERHAALVVEHDVPDEVLVRLTRVLTKLLDGRDAGLTG